MGVSSSREGRVYHETQSIVTRVHQKYNTESNGRNVADRLHVYRETRIVEDQGKKEIFHKESVKRVVDPQKGGKDETLARKTVKISFNRKDLSAPLAVTLESITRQDNWPPLPSGFPIGPCFYQDINVDIPLEFQKIVRMLYYLWMFHALMLLLNILGGLGLFIAFKSGVTFGLAILYFLIFTPFSYICWFRPIYKAFRSDSSFNFMVFFFVFFFQLIVSIVNAIGIPSMGTCGFVLGLSILGDHEPSASYIVGIIIFMIALGFAAVAAIDAILLIKVHRIYRSTGASFAKAQVEFSQGVMRNEHVQSFTANAASAAVRNQFSGATTPGGTAASPRF
ncbi:secretory carrier-associated membrane protein 5A isoform X4 [Macrobrachium rosenbergii]|uniref:secretory carrier-associated membrane protein 5A isoform X4 n=1 Tax=Macrobrachium rosenbergii TaxID=79674 RepID=UPI0034D70B48